jgi:hypothetical protein
MQPVDPPDLGGCGRTKDFTMQHDPSIASGGHAADLRAPSGAVAIVEPVHPMADPWVRRRTVADRRGEPVARYRVGPWAEEDPNPHGGRAVTAAATTAGGSGDNGSAAEDAVPSGGGA